MRIIPDQLKSKNLVPFRKRQGKYNIPGMTSENQPSMDRVDSDLSREEQGYIQHYLGYADALLRSAEENVPPAPPEGEFPRRAQVIEERRNEERHREVRCAEESPVEVTPEPNPEEEDPSHKAA
ncbi:MAG: hypothetical protein ACXVK3_18140 [Candidatus Angelobacter sp.]